MPDGDYKAWFDLAGQSFEHLEKKIEALQADLKSTQVAIHEAELSLVRINELTKIVDENYNNIVKAQKQMERLHLNQSTCPARRIFKWSTAAVLITILISIYGLVFQYKEMQIMQDRDLSQKQIEEMVLRTLANYKADQGITVDDE